MKESTLTDFGIYNEMLGHQEKKVMITEPRDIEKALRIAEDAYMMYERGLMNDRKFLFEYTIISEDNLFFHLNKVDFLISFSVASMMKYGGKDLLKRLINNLKRNKDNELIRITINPK